MYNRPHFSEYVLSRLVTIAVVIFILSALFIRVFIDNNEVSWYAITLIGLAFILFVYVIHRAAKSMERELTTINQHMKNFDQVDKIDYKARYFTQEFEDINQNLIKVLKSSKKREDVKQRYNAKLKLKNRQRGDMISAIAHEFRNPIASIMGYAQTLDEDKEIPAALQEKFLHKIYNNGTKIEALLSRLVLWNKFESGEATLHPVKFDIYTLVLEVKASLHEKYPQREIITEGESYVIEADRTLLEIVLKNLMENALKYSKDEIKVDVSEGKIAVTDKGLGISSTDISKVTKKFYRSGTHTWDNSMGLGLSIVKSILALHGSTLEIESQKDEGSTFSFTI
ncbi:HAMP domain-containing sensor histidine kinase [Sulfurovum sp.]|uniref:sensor histidine kinase n=1 Tax=Sulfurovum sp. TaxID=1969726 RepID=UPI002867BABC|nr:HAMP domain-containing sensor histidine kinase [Sulfurovum sp.]